MSRTDKDAPDWVVAEWWEPFHICGHRGVNLTPRLRPARCTLPPEPTVSYYNNYAIQHGICHWIAVTRWRASSPPKWYIDYVWTNRNRTRVRDQLRRARGEYRATGEVDVVPNVDQHRHGATWVWN